MQRLNQHSRVSPTELKAQIIKKIGSEKSKMYFYYLNKFLSLKLSKVEFNKLCFRVLGRDNVPLHNQFICSILRNACNAKVLPPTLPSCYKEVLTYTSDGSYPFPNGKVDFASHQSTFTGDNINLEANSHKLVQHHQLLLERPEKEGEFLVCHHDKLPLVKLSTGCLVSVHSKEGSSISVIEDRKEISTVSPLQAPLGIPFCAASAGSACKQRPLASHDRCASSYGGGHLLDTETLRERMQQIVAAQGLEGVSMDSAKLLSSGLDAYLKGLIKSCVELVDTRCGYDSIKNNNHKDHSGGKLINGLLPGHHLQLQGSNRLLDGMQEQTPHFSISLLDFKVAMELNPLQLGEDWPLLLEKICTHAFEE